MIAAFVASSSLGFAADSKEVKEPVSIADRAWSTTIIGGGVKTNDRYTDGNVFLTLPVWSSIGRDGTLGGGYAFVEPYTSVGTHGEVASSLGFSYRHLFNHEPVTALKKKGRASFMEEGWFLGGNLFVDMLDTQHHNKFWQLGVGAEIGTRYLELRGNYYIPLTSNKLAERHETTQTFSSSSTVYQTSGAGATDPFATGNQIVQDVNLTTTAVTTTRTTTVRTVTEIFEKGMEGWDAEVSALVPWVDQWMDVRLIGGYFSFDNQPFGPQEFGTGKVHGWKAGAEVRPVPAVLLSAYWYEDELFTGANWTVGVQLQVPLDRTWKDAFKVRRRHLVEHLAEPVHRQNDAIKVGNSKKENSTSNSSVSRVTHVVAQTKQHLVLQDDVIFVNNGAATNNGIGAGDDPTGNGTAEKPKATIQAGADIAATNNLTTGRVWNVYTQYHPFKPYYEDVAISQSTNFISSDVSIMGAAGKIFGTGGKPMVGDSVTGSFTTIGGPLDFVGITGYEIHGPLAGAISATDVRDLRIASNRLFSDGSAINVSMTNGNSGSATITGNEVLHASGNQNGIDLLVDGAGSFLDATINNNSISDAIKAGVSIRVENDAQADLRMMGNFLGFNQDNGLSIKLDNRGDLSAVLGNNRFELNFGSGLYVSLDHESAFDFESFGDTFLGNTKQGVHIESHNESILYPSVIENAHFLSNDVSEIDASTTTKGFIQLSVVRSLIEADAPVAIHGSAGEGFGSTVDLALFFFEDTIRLERIGAATGISIESPLNGVVALGLQSTTLEVTGFVLGSTGISLVASGTPDPFNPNIGAQIYDSTIAVRVSPSVAIDVANSGSSGTALDVQNTVITSDGTGVKMITLDSSFIGAGVSDGSQITSGGEGIHADSLGTDGIAIGVLDSAITSDRAGIALFEDSTSQLDAFISGNTFNTNSAIYSSLTFEKQGLSTEAFFEDNTFSTLVSGIIMLQTSTNPFTVTITGNTVLSAPGAGIDIANQAGTMEAVVNGNSVTTSTGSIGYLFDNSGTALNINSAPTVLEDNTASGPGFKFLFSTPGVNGTLQLNGTPVPLPATVP